MNRLQFKRFVFGVRCRVRGVVCNTAESETDPSFAMTGTQLAVASMLGQPIPQPIVNYSFNSATSPDDVASIDRFGADPFEVYAQMKRDAEHVHAAADKVNEMIHSSEYQELVKQQKSE